MRHFILNIFVKQSPFPNETQIRGLFSSGHVSDSSVLPVPVRVAVPETGCRRRQHPGIRQEAGCVPTSGGHVDYNRSGTWT